VGRKKSGGARDGEGQGEERKWGNKRSSARPKLCKRRSAQKKTQKGKKKFRLGKKHGTYKNTGKKQQINGYEKRKKNKNRLGITDGRKTDTEHKSNPYA